MTLFFAGYVKGYCGLGKINFEIRSLNLMVLFISEGEITDIFDFPGNIKKIIRKTERTYQNQFCRDRSTLYNNNNILGF